MGATGKAFRIESVAHGETVLSGPLEVRLRERIGWTPLAAGERGGVPGWVARREGYEAEVLATDLADALAAGAKATLTIVLKDAGGGNVTVSIAGMRRGPVEWLMERGPFTRRMVFRHEGEAGAGTLTVSA
ncbi:MAG: hypothetical protein M5U26_16840 [Planctomycetota bacterium]|nr:hypothetical protein [Planctomycetota bacterium]